MMERRTPAWYLIMLVTALVMALALSLVSVHIRLLNSGLGCTDWPHCYGRIGTAGAPQSAAESITDSSSAGTVDAATRAHRTIASALGLIILGVAVAALARRPRLTGFLPPTLLLTVMIGLAVLGNWSSGLQRPGVVMANFTGGIALAALLWWLLMAARAHRPSSAPALRHWTAAALLLLVAQLVLGGLVSAYFAGLACGPSASCNGNWMPAVPWATLSGLFDLLELDAAGKVIGGDQLTGLHMAHRLLGMALVPIIAWLAWRLHRDGRSLLAGMLTVIIVAEAALGVASVHLNLHPGLVLSHYALALALLLALLVPLHPAENRSTGAQR